MPLTCRDNEATFIPPLQLACSDASEPKDVARCKCFLHGALKMFKTSHLQNVLNIVGPDCEESTESLSTEG